MTVKSPNISQLTPNLTPTLANIAQLAAKVAQDGHQEPPTGPPWTPKSTKNVVGLFDFILRASRQRSRPRSQKIPKITPQRASRWPSWPPLGPSWLSRWPSWLALGPSWLHLGLMWTPSWRHLGPSDRHFGAPAPGQNRPRPSPGYFPQEDRPGNLPDPLRASVFLLSGPIFKASWFDFG